jgi:hypothetical protein
VAAIFNSSFIWPGIYDIAIRSLAAWLRVEEVTLAVFAFAFEAGNSLFDEESKFGFWMPFVPQFDITRAEAITRSIAALETITALADWTEWIVFLHFKARHFLPLEILRTCLLVNRNVSDEKISKVIFDRKNSTHVKMMINGYLRAYLAAR